MTDRPQRWTWFAGRSLRARLAALALLLAAVFVAVGVVESYRERIVFDREMTESAQGLSVGLRTTLEVSANEMVHLGALIASEPTVRQLMREAYQARLEEGGPVGGARTAALRETLAENLRLRRSSIWSNEFSTRQVSFHLLPGGVNFLRVGDPRLYGDVVERNRPMVAAAHEFDIPISGFEVGRTYAGIRGVYPLRVDNLRQGELVTIGSVEVGVSMQDLLAGAAARFNAAYVLALDRRFVEGVMTPDDIRAVLRESAACDCYADALGGEHANALFDAQADPAALQPDRYSLVSVDGRWYGVARVLLSGLGESLESSGRGAFGSSVFVFFDRTELVEQYRGQRQRMVVGLLLAYAVALLFTWLILRRVAATEDALAAEQRFRTALFAVSPDSVLVTDREGVIVEVNPRFCEVTGYTPAEVVGRNARILQSGNTAPEVYAEMWQTLLAGREWRGDLQNRRKDGSLYWDAHAVVPVTGRDGEITHFVSFQRDISKRHDMERALTASERLYRSVHDNVQEAIFLVRVEGDDFLYVGNNPRHEETTGLTAERLRGARPHDILPPHMAESVAANYRRCVAERKTIRYEEELTLPAGTRIWMTSLAPVFDDAGRVEMIVGLSVDVTEQKHAEAELRRLATTDVLTGLANRRHFLERAEQELDRVRRYATPSAFIMLDIDHFKRINDTWGHATGDAVLRRMALALGEAVRATDLVGRLGGEEFGVLLPETDLDAALNLAERLRAAVTEATVPTDGEALHFSASFGVTLLHADDDNVDMPMARADAALYAAKFAGRNRVKWRVR
ncbi:MAG: diguanylate cyclase [Pseudazoarcus pumilus]|nr:diguanylate cyclase [Pseudazoarcus pumilus]